MWRAWTVRVIPYERAAKVESRCAQTAAQGWGCGVTKWTKDDVVVRGHYVVAYTDPNPRHEGERFYSVWEMVAGQSVERTGADWRSVEPITPPQVDAEKLDALLREEDGRG